MSDKQQLRFQREWEVKKGEDMSTRTSEEKGKTRKNAPGSIQGLCRKESDLSSGPLGDVPGRC